VLAAMNCCLYLAIERLPLGRSWFTVADLPIRFAGDTGTASRQERRYAAGSDL
jgi:threonine/homoserine efflux transporter RhtA